MIYPLLINQTYKMLKEINPSFLIGFISDIITDEENQ
jgi:hypothetical protein